jgi:hypothetical protein
MSCFTFARFAAVSRNPALLAALVLRVDRVPVVERFAVLPLRFVLVLRFVAVPRLLFVVAMVTSPVCG